VKAVANVAHQVHTVENKKESFVSSAWEELQPILTDALVGLGIILVSVALGWIIGYLCDAEEAKRYHDAERVFSYLVFCLFGVKTIVGVLIRIYNESKRALRRVDEFA